MPLPKISLCHWLDYIIEQAIKNENLSRTPILILAISLQFYKFIAAVYICD